MGNQKPPDIAPSVTLLGLVAINTCAMALMTVSGLFLGFSGWVLLLTGWLGGAVLTLCVLALVVWLQEWQEVREAPQTVDQAKVSTERNIAKMVAEWEEDRLDDGWAQHAQQHSKPQASMSFYNSPEKHVRDGS